MSHYSLILKKKILICGGYDEKAIDPVCAPLCCQFARDCDAKRECVLLWWARLHLLFISWRRFTHKENCSLEIQSALYACDATLKSLWRVRDEMLAPRAHQSWLILHPNAEPAIPVGVTFAKYHAGRPVGSHLRITSSSVRWMLWNECL